MEVNGEFGILISYPVSTDDPIPSEFSAYGTTDQGGAVTASMSGLGGGTFSYKQLLNPPKPPPPGWMLQCAVTNPPTTTCTLTVSQGSQSAQSNNLQIQVV